MHSQHSNKREELIRCDQRTSPLSSSRSPSAPPKAQQQFKLLKLKAEPYCHLFHQLKGFDRFS
jgi:hypothetical protein